MRYIILLSVFIFSSCQTNERQTENYGDINQGPGGKNLVIEAEHQGGWGRSECLLCHQAALNVHRNSNSVIDPEALNELVWQNGGSKYCLTCHGPNGVQ
ncbi:MAG: hypothetical protein BroJett040_11590 [Oligoflexia bacterium]|nr:MAG: hypothetical protein BroJett040_11590 [Oligoflexia bacterium]